MKTYELQPTQENLIFTYEQDSIDRNVHLHYFIDILDSVEDCCSVAIDGKWGTGKTFFVKQAKMILDSFNNHTQFVSEEDRARVCSTWEKYHSKDSERELMPQVCVYYDAWQFDNDDDPLLSLMYEILNSVAVDYSFNKSRDCVKILAGVVDAFSGRNLAGLIDTLKDKEDPMEGIKNNREVLSMVNEFLDIILSERGNRIVVFVDELDRCNPSYAVRLLERIKHYFSKETVTFVFSVNTMELQHTIRQYYGANFNASRYLDRFFDMRVSLPPANMQKYYSLVSFKPDSNMHNMIVQAVINRYEFELREISKYLRLVKIATSKAMNEKTPLDFSHAEGRGRRFALLTITPILIGLQLYDLSLYNSFVRGGNYKPLLDVLIDSVFTDWLCSILLDPNETIKETGNPNEVVVDLNDKVIGFYNALFNTAYDHSVYRKRIGDITITATTQVFIKNVVSLLSDCADYSE